MLSGFLMDYIDVVVHVFQNHIRDFIILNFGETQNRLNYLLIKIKWQKKKIKVNQNLIHLWIYGIIISVLLLASMYTDGSSGNVRKTNISEFEKFLNEGDIKRGICNK